MHVAPLLNPSLRAHYKRFERAQRGRHHEELALARAQPRRPQGLPENIVWPLRPILGATLLQPLQSFPKLGGVQTDCLLLDRDTQRLVVG